MRASSFSDQIVWVIGASSGIGRALAVELAGRGATVVLSARRGDALAEVQNSIGMHHPIYPLDVADLDAVMQTAATIYAAHGRIERVVFMSALYTPMRLNALDVVATKALVDVNLMGAFHLVHAVLPLLQAQPWGQLVLCGSVAGYMGLPGGQPYSATKAALINLAESLAAECPAHLDIKLISPGFVRTALTDKNSFAMPMIVTPEIAANAIANGLCSKQFEIHFPKRFTLMLKAIRALPYAISLKLCRAL